MVGFTFTSCILPGRETVLIAWVTALEVILRHRNRSEDPSRWNRKRLCFFIATGYAGADEEPNQVGRKEEGWAQNHS